MELESLVWSSLLLCLVYVIFVLAMRVYFNHQPFPSWLHEFNADATHRGNRDWAIVTGGNSGIGYETALELAKHGVNVIIACRNLQKGQSAMDSLKLALFKSDSKSISGEIKLMRLDLADVSSVREFIQEVRTFFGFSEKEGNKEEVNHSNEQARYLRILCNNAGMVTVDHQFIPIEIRKDSNNRNNEIRVEEQWLVNYLMPVMLTESLLPLLLVSGDACNGNDCRPARVVFVSSLAHSWSSLSLLDSFKSDLLSGKHADWSTHPALTQSLMPYAESKLAVNLYVSSLHRRLQCQTDIKVVSVHPGFIDTNIPHRVNESNWIADLFFRGVFYPLVMAPVTYSCEVGARTQIHCCLAGEHDSSVQSGAYHFDCRPRVPGHGRSALLDFIREDENEDGFWKATQQFLDLI